MREARLEERFGVVRLNITVLAAALLAAHATSPAHEFFASDVRFFFYLFANWLERDVLYPGETLDLTQVRRLFQRLRRLRLARSARRATRSRSSGTAYTLTGAGVRTLLEAVVRVVEARSFEEAVFVIAFVATYRPHLVAMAGPRASVSRELDPAKLTARARRRVERVAKDLVKRTSDAARLHREVELARAAGLGDTAVAQRIEKLGVYQLQHIRSFADFILSFPPELLSFELGPGFAMRGALIFQTLAEYAEGQLQALRGLESRLASFEPAHLGRPSRPPR